jgi:hypothetical protein
MTGPTQRIVFDPEKAKLDMPINEAFALTQVRSLQDFQRLVNKLPEMRGSSYFFINILSKKARLIITIITAEDQEITATYALDHNLLEIAQDELMRAGGEDGNYAVPADLMRKIHSALHHPDWQFFKSTLEVN